MRKYTITILILTLFLAPFVSQADLPIFIDDGGGGGGSGSGSGSGTGTNNTTTSSNSDLVVKTTKADSITQSTATLYGEGGYTTSSPNPPLITAYFRYAKAKNNPPIFCNDIYGSNMIATGDIFLGTTYEKDNHKNIYDSSKNSNSFSQQVTGLSPNTTYYYCAIISNKNNIAYGGNAIVKEFHTNCYETTVNTKDATSVKSTSARLNGSYCSAKIIPNTTEGKTIEKVSTYFEYKKDIVIAGGTTTDKNGNCLNETINPPECTTWKKINKQEYQMDNNANLYGDINFNFLGLTPDTSYLFKAVVETTNSKKEIKTTKGASFNFRTIPGGGGNNTGSSGCTSCLKPTVTVKATPSSIKSGEKSIISWTSTNATSCKVSGNEDIDETAGSFNTGPLTNSKSYSVICTGANGTGSGNAYVYVNTGNGFGVDGNCYDGIKNGNETSIDIGGRCGGNPNDPNNPYDKGIWGSPDGGITGTWGTGTDSGTWRATSGTGGRGIVYWAGNGDGTGTWYSTTGNGTWTNGRGTGSTGTGTWTNLSLGQTATPPNDAIVRYHEGIETVFIRQIMRNPIFTQKYGYKTGMNLQTFAEDLADQFARAFGYINSSGREIRVSLPDIAAYQLVLVGNKLTVYEYYNNRIVDIRNVTTVFKNASGYEYYFKKN